MAPRCREREPSTSSAFGQSPQSACPYSLIILEPVRDNTASRRLIAREGTPRSASGRETRGIPAFKGLKVFAGVDAQGAMILEEPRRKPTIHDAFRHTLGIGTGGGPTPVDRLYIDKGLAMNRLDSLAQEMQLLGEVPLLYHPGDRWLYGFGHDVQAIWSSTSPACRSTGSWRSGCSPR